MIWLHMAVSHAHGLCLAPPGFSVDARMEQNNAHFSVGPWHSRASEHKQDAGIEAGTPGVSLCLHTGPATGRHQPDQPTLNKENTLYFPQSDGTG